MNEVTEGKVEPEFEKGKGAGIKLQEVTCFKKES